MVSLCRTLAELLITTGSRARRCPLKIPTLYDSNFVQFVIYYSVYEVYGVQHFKISIDHLESQNTCASTYHLKMRILVDAHLHMVVRIGTLKIASLELSIIGFYVYL